MEQCGELQCAYGCKMYALQEALSLAKDNPSQKKTIEGAVMPLFTELENLKKSANTQHAAVQESLLRVADREYQEADRRDRTGQSDKITAGKFNSADVLYTVYIGLMAKSEQPSPEVQQKHRYAHERAIVLAQALHAKQPPPPPSGAPLGMAPPAGAMPGASPTGGLVPGAPPMPQQPPEASIPAPKKGGIHFQVIHTHPPNQVWDEARTKYDSSWTVADYKTEARLQAKYAASAMMFQDVQTALKCTNTAIQLLRAAGISPSAQLS